MNALIQTWLSKFYDKEIKEVEGTIKNYELWVLGAEGGQYLLLQETLDSLREYLGVLVQLRRDLDCIE